MRTTSTLFAFGLVLFSVVSCSSDKKDEPLYRQVVETRTLLVGGGGATVIEKFHGGLVELIIPGDVAQDQVQVTVSFVTGTTTRGRTPINGAGLLVEPTNLLFRQPVRVRQVLPPPPPQRKYVAVVVPPKGKEFEARAVARPVGLWAGNPHSVNGLAATEVWESLGTGGGLWGMALDQDGDAFDGGTPDAKVVSQNDAAPSAVDAAAPPADAGISADAANVAPTPDAAPASADADGANTGDAL